MPYFTYRPNSMTVLSGAMATLFCGGGGSPAPTVTWHRLHPLAGMMLYQGEVEEVMADERVLLSDTFLLFTQVRLADEGFYFCSLSSPLANLTSNKALLNVYSEWLSFSISIDPSVCLCSVPLCQCPSDSAQLGTGCH